MSFVRKRKGALGEELAEAFLVLHGFKVIERNWRCMYGEIDLIVKKRRELRFVEVKYRTTTEFGFPEVSITPMKMQHLTNASECYLRSLKQLPAHYQIDVISIVKIGSDKPEFHWIEAVSREE